LEIDLKYKIVIQELKAWMDGGSVTLDCKNDKGQRFEIEFVQEVVLNPREFNKIPGRLYFNGKLVDERSDLERKILENLEKAKLKNFTKLEENILNEKIKYIKSEQFLLNIKKTEKLKFK